MVCCFQYFPYPRGSVLDINVYHQGSNFYSCVWRAVSSDLSHHHYNDYELAMRSSLACRPTWRAHKSFKATAIQFVFIFAQFKLNMLK